MQTNLIINSSTFLFVNEGHHNYTFTSVVLLLFCSVYCTVLLLLYSRQLALQFSCTDKIKFGFSITSMQKIKYLKMDLH